MTGEFIPRILDHATAIALEDYRQTVEKQLAVSGTVMLDGDAATRLAGNYSLNEHEAVASWVVALGMVPGGREAFLQPIEEAKQVREAAREAEELRQVDEFNAAFWEWLDA